MLQVGRHVTVEEVTGGRPLPTNVEVHPWVPQREILDHASAFLTHAGMGGASEAMLTGTPVVTAPQAADQFENATMLAAAGRLEQGDACFALQRLQLLRDRRRRHRQHVGDRSDRAVVGELAQHPQPLHIHVGMLLLALRMCSWTAHSLGGQAVPVTRYRVDLALLAVAAVWGSSYLAIKESAVPAGVFGFLAVVLALLVFTIRTCIAARRFGAPTAREIPAQLVTAP